MTSNQKIYKVLSKIKNKKQLSFGNVICFKFNHSWQGVGIIPFADEVLILEKIQFEGAIKIGARNYSQDEVEVLGKFSGKWREYFIKSSIDSLFIYIFRNITKIIKLLIKIKIDIMLT